MNTERGVAVVLALVVTGLLAALAAGLTTLVFAHRLAAGNYVDDVALLNAAESGVEAVAAELGEGGDWDGVLGGQVVSARSLGPPTGLRALPGGATIDLAVLTNQLNCGKRSSCSPQQLAAVSPGRPWGANNPVWRLFLYAPIREVGPVSSTPDGLLLVWVGDDPQEADGDPLVDGDLAVEAPGSGILRVRAEAFGVRGRRGIEAELRKICAPGAEGPICQPGLRVQAWQELRGPIP